VLKLDLDATVVETQGLKKQGGKEFTFFVLLTDIGEEVVNPEGSVGLCVPPSSSAMRSGDSVPSCLAER
jgi:hypothetical protein